VEQHPTLRRNGSYPPRGCLDTTLSKTQTAEGNPGKRQDNLRQKEASFCVQCRYVAGNSVILLEAHSV
jgi:hypothetical protein